MKSRYDLLMIVTTKLCVRHILPSQSQANCVLLIITVNKNTLNKFENYLKFEVSLLRTLIFETLLYGHVHTNPGQHIIR